MAIREVSLVTETTVGESVLRILDRFAKIEMKMIFADDSQRRLGNLRRIEGNRSIDPSDLSDLNEAAGVLVSDLIAMDVRSIGQDEMASVDLTVRREAPVHVDSKETAMEQDRFVGIQL